MAIRIPRILHHHRKVAEEYLKEKRIRDMEFSRHTYQVQVADRETGKKQWAFVQLDQAGGLLDRFCSCDVEDGMEACEHVAAAYLAIYGGRQRPVHRRFLDSLWVKITQLALDSEGDDAAVLKKESDNVYSAGGRFTIRVTGKKGAERLEQIFHPEEAGEEETSLKLANLSMEELEQLQEGKATPELRYELSFWSDIAKWAMILEEFGETPKVEFVGEGLPKALTATIKGIELTLQVHDGEWSRLLPALTGYELPLEVRHLQEEAIDRIRYDAEKRAFIVDARQEAKVEGLDKGTKLGDWTFLENKGFYCTTEHPLLGKREIPEEQIPYALTEFGSLLRRHIEEVEIHAVPQELSTHLHFDNTGALHISSYLFESGDLSQPGAALFDEWVYLPTDGFYRIDPEGENYHQEIIPRKEVSDYVTLNRGWFNAQSGFQTHLAQVEVYLTYRLNSNDTLEFLTRLEAGEGGEVTFDFGRWLYIEEQGFFTKRTATLGSFLSGGATVSARDLPKFIKEHHDDLLHVRKFFCPVHPVHRVELKLVLERDHTIVVTPSYQLLPEFRSKRLRVFGDVVYLEGEGFSTLPAGQVLPKSCTQQRVVKQHEMPRFLAEELPRLVPFLGEVDKRLTQPREVTIVATEAGENRGEGLITLRLEVVSELGSVSVTEVAAAAQQKQRFLFTDAGLLDLDDQQFEWLKRIGSEGCDRENAMVTLSSLELLRLHALAGLEIADEIEHRQLELLLGKRDVGKPKLTGLKSELRPYQELGVQWLWYLYRNRLSGLLCDDMGLGKTHQAMALLAAIRAKKKRARFLVVCPTSVLYHWQDKLEQFLPDLKVRTYYGQRRTLQQKGAPYDLLLTSYGVVRRDHEQLAKMKFEVAVLDEIQVAKNHTSRVHHALRKLTPGMFLGLTGTPMENKLRELKSLFDIILPGYMPGDTHYRNFFVAPIEKLHDRKRQELLVQFVKPFLLRRKKQDVLSELPDKTEDVAHCGLSDDQRRLYQEVIERNAQPLIGELVDESQKVSYVHIFALLTLLKQICNHPAIYEKNIDRWKEYRSGKFDLFCELISEALASQQKVVVFTQFLGMMDIIEAYLKEHGIGYASIRGATRDRKREMDRFQTDPECQVFVGSLQASGVGIDLTAGSVVIHYDRWWNPAREDQATDRVHRIGQTRGVQVFKLVTKDTLEERIDLIIEQKKALLAKVITADEENVLKQLDRKELMALLQSVHQPI